MAIPVQSTGQVVSLSYLTLPHYTTNRWSVRNFGNDFEISAVTAEDGSSASAVMIYIDLPSSEKCPPHNYNGEWEIHGGGSCCVDCDETDKSDRQSSEFRIRLLINTDLVIW